MKDKINLPVLWKHLAKIKAFANKHDTFDRERDLIFETKINIL